MAVTVLLSVDDFLTHTGLNLLIHVRPCETDEQAVGPCFVYKAEFAYDGLVMICVVEAFHTVELAVIHSACLEIFNRGVDRIVIVRIILERVDFIFETGVESLAEVYIRFVGIERTIGV